MQVPLPTIRRMGTVEPRDVFIERPWIFQFHMDTTNWGRDEASKYVLWAANEVDKANIRVSKNRRSQGHHGATDPLEAWDVTFLYDNLETATKKCTEMYEKLDDQMHPIVGYFHQFNFDLPNSLIILEVTNSQVLRDLTASEVVNWTFIVAHGIAIVDTAPPIVDLKSLEKVMDKIKKYNERSGHRRVWEGGKFVERVVLNKRLLKEPTIREARKTETNRVYWDRNDARFPGPRVFQNDKRSLELDDDRQVLVTLGNWYDAPKDYIKQDLEAMVSHKVRKVLHKYQVLEDTEDRASISWSTTKQNDTYKLTCRSTEMAQVLCKKVQSISVQLADHLGHVSFQSAYHTVSRQESAAFWDTLKLTDVEPDELKVARELGVTANTPGSSGDQAHTRSMHEGSEVAESSWVGLRSSSLNEV